MSGERRIARLLITFTVLFAVIVQNFFFAFSTNMTGDVQYHRGVALTMTAGNFPGQSPVRGIVSYFGGFYPMVFGWASHLGGWSFDGLLSVVSWLAVICLPLALLYLGRSLWPSRALEPALLMFLGTIGSSLGRDPNAEWVFSALPSGANEWPLYPRDICLVLIVVALGIVTRDCSVKRLVGAGALCALGIATQSQVGVYGMLAVSALSIWQGRHTSTRATQIRRAMIPLGVAIAGSAWWWLPRVSAAIKSRGFLLASYPGLARPNTSLTGIINALGITGALAALGLAIVLRHGIGAQRFFGWWLAVFLPFGIFGRILGDVGLLTERRVWFFAAIPIVVCATSAAAWLTRIVPHGLALVAVAALVIVPSTIESIHTRDLIDAAWRPPAAGSPFGSRAWNGALHAVRQRVEASNGLAVLAPDVDALFLWQRTGAQPFSLWLTGPTKLGFDPARLTRWGMLDRLHLQNRAFKRGLGGLCALAREVRADDLVLRHRGHLLGTRDLRPASRYRVSPRDRSTETIRRTVNRHTEYFDVNSTEFLALHPGGSVPLGWSSPSVREIEVDLFLPVDPRSPPVLREPGGAIVVPILNADATRLIYRTPTGVPSGTTLRARSIVNVERVIGFEPTAFPLPSGAGVVDLPIAQVCPAAPAL